MRVKGEYQEAESLLQEGLTIYRELYNGPNSNTVQTLAELGEVYRSRGDLDLAELPLREALEMTRAALGDDHPAVSNRMNGLANLHYRKREYDQAESLFRQALRIDRKVHGDDHRSVMVGINNLALVLGAKGLDPTPTRSRHLPNWARCIGHVATSISPNCRCAKRSR